MKVRRILGRVKHIIRHTPPISWPFDASKNNRILREREHDILQRDRQIHQLVERNDEWAREVRQLRRQDEPLHIVWPVRKEDLIAASLGQKSLTHAPVSHKSESLNIVWVIPPMGSVSGGHTSILRVVAGLEAKGHTCSLYIYDPENTSSNEIIVENLKKYPQVRAKIIYNFTKIEACDVLFATSWHTAYPVYNSKATTNKYYFVQDFEPAFDPAGSYSALAENTYKFGLHGITLGLWMKEKLESEYGMLCDNFDLAVTNDEYSLRNRGERKKVVFYARPVTPRRGFELGVLALEVFHKKHPEYEIHLVGWDVARYDIPFEYVNHGIITIAQLDSLYNECAAGLVLSFTNMSLLPLEMMASGCIPVVNEAPCTTSVGYSKFISYAQPTAAELAQGLSDAIVKAKDKMYVEEMSQHTHSFNWDQLNDSIDRIIKIPR
jgi:O-antigen biosynthesis protein